MSALSRPYILPRFDSTRVSHERAKASAPNGESFCRGSSIRTAELSPRLTRVSALNPRQKQKLSRTALTVVASKEMPGDREGDGANMYVPPDIFQGDGVIGKSSRVLTTLLTMVAVRVVMEQMSGSRHRSPLYNRLRDYINEEEPIKDGTTWLEKLMRHPENDMRLLALRIIETREKYLDGGFDFEELKEATEIQVKKDNAQLMRQWMTDCLAVGGDEDTCTPDVSDQPE